MSPGHIDGLFYLVLAVCIAGGVLGFCRLFGISWRIYRQSIERNR